MHGPWVAVDSTKIAWSGSSDVYYQNSSHYGSRHGHGHENATPSLATQGSTETKFYGGQTERTSQLSKSRHHQSNHDGSGHKDHGKSSKKKVRDKTVSYFSSCSHQ